MINYLILIIAYLGMSVNLNLLYYISYYSTYFQAMLDVAADSGWLRTSLNIMHLVKMIIQGCWLKDDPLLQLPIVEPDQLHLFYLTQ